MGVVLVLSGNPRPGSRTSAVGAAVGHELCREPSLGCAAVETVELSDVTRLLFDPGAGQIAGLRRRVAEATVLVVATPSYKASLPGLLKVFLDGFGPDSLSVTAVVPVVVAGSPEHAASTSRHLHDVLTACGAERVAAPVVVLESRLSSAGALIAERLPRVLADLKAG